MTRGSPVRLLVRFALPLILASLMQQLYTLCDSVIVGRLLGAQAVPERQMMAIAQSSEKSRFRSNKEAKNMKYLKQISIILAISCLGELLSRWIPAPVPGSIYGIALLFLGLLTKCIPYEAVKDTAHFLVEIMPVMFIPAAAGLLESWELIASSWVSYLLLILVTTVAVMGVAGRVTQLFTGKGEKKDAE